MDKNGLLIVLLFSFMIVLDSSNALNSRKLVATPDPNGSSNATQDSPLPSPPPNEKKPNLSLATEPKDTPMRNPSDVESKGLNDANNKTSSENSSDKKLDKGKSQDGKEKGENQTQLKSFAGKSCKGNPICSDQEKTMIACIQDFENGSNNLTLLVQNERDITLKVKLTFGTSMNNYLPPFEIPSHGTEKVNITFSGDKSTKVILNAGNGDCELQIGAAKTMAVDDPSKSKDVDDPSKSKDVDNPSKTNDVDDLTKLKGIDSPTDGPAKPRDANASAESPAKPKNVDNPSDSPVKPKDADDSARSNEVDGSSKPKEADSPAKPKEVDDAAKPKEVDGPAKSPKGIDDPAKSKDVDNPAKSKDVDPAKPKDVDDASKPKDVDDASKPKKVDDTSKSKEVDDTSKSKGMGPPPKSETVDVPSKPISVDTPISQSNLLTQLSFYSKQVTPMYGAYFAFLAALVIGGSWAFCSFRKRRKDSGIPYQELEMGLPESSHAIDVETAEGWDQDWDDDDWDEDKAIRSPGGVIQTKTISSNGLTSRAAKKDSWDANWDD